ncbi:hypothetical protein [Kribbella sp. CA-294648]|uniref:hypothetical protein n=1 Tax=Kribbella sp. CA-294648 TaxID=3239948 RepID=UPI003D8C4FC1
MGEWKSMAAPLSFEQFKEWLVERVPTEPLQSARTRYDSSINQALLSANNSTLWQKFVAHMRELGDEYYVASDGFVLFTTVDPPKWVGKTFDSVLDKAYRKNVLLNQSWPAAPKGGWIDQQTLYGTVNDLVRTTIVVKYLDGVQFVADEIGRLCDSEGLAHRVDFEAREEGYYAAHVYVTMPVVIPEPNWSTSTVDISHEIQITTQLQDSIRKLTHEGYASRRSVAPDSDAKWQWDHKHSDFIPNYLGHILHYVEGMIMEIRDRRGSK